MSQQAVKERILPIFISGGALALMLAVIVLTLFVGPAASVPSERLIPNEAYLNGAYRLLPMSLPASLHRHRGES